MYSLGSRAAEAMPGLQEATGKLYRTFQAPADRPNALQDEMRTLDITALVVLLRQVGILNASM